MRRRNPYVELGEVYLDEEPDRQERFWDHVDSDGWENQAFNEVEIDPVALANSWAMDGSGTTLLEAYRDFATDSQVAAIEDLRSRAAAIARECCLLVDLDAKQVIDGWHRIAAMALEGIRSARALDLADERVQNNPPEKFRIGILHRGYDGFIVRGYVGRKAVGHVTVARSFRYFDVIRSEVDEDLRLQGIGLAMYQAAHEEACRQGLPLRSEGYQRSPEATRVWERVPGARRVADGRNWDYLAECDEPKSNPPRANPPLGAPWLTPRVAARLHDLERCLINERTGFYGPREGQLVCQEAWVRAAPIVELESGQEAEEEAGLVHWPGIGASMPSAPGKPPGWYWHYWLRLGDGTIVDVASAQFGQISPLVIPPGHPLQKRYLPEAVDPVTGPLEDVWDYSHWPKKNPPKAKAAMKRVRKAVGKKRQCYPAAEVVYHAGGGRRAGLTPVQQRHEGESHWWVRGPGGEVLDPASAQFNRPVPYDKGRGRGFLTARPSRRARELAKRSGVKLNPPRSWQFGWHCPSPPDYWPDLDWGLVDYIVDHADEIDCEEFLAEIGRDEVESQWYGGSGHFGWAEGGYDPCRDWHVSWYRSSYPDGTPIMFHNASGIEHVWEPRGYSGPARIQQNPPYDPSRWQDVVKDPEWVRREIGASRAVSEIERAIKVGAVPPLEFQGAGASASVFCDANGIAFKVGHTPLAGSTLDTEVAWLRAAKAHPDTAHLVPEVYGWFPDEVVIVRECVRGEGEGWRRPHMDWHAKLMSVPGWSLPESGDRQWVLTDSGPVIIDGGYAHRRGEVLASHVDHLLDTEEVTRGKIGRYDERLSDLAWAVYTEKALGRLPAWRAGPLLARIRAAGDTSEWSEPK